MIAVAVAVVVAAVGPWVGYNLARFQRPVLISTNFDLNLLGSSCPEVMHGPRIGTLGFCTFNRIPTGADQSLVASKMRKEAFTVIRDNLGRYPEVVLARIGRTWSLYRPLDGLDVGLAEGRPHWVTWLGLIWYWPMLAVADRGSLVAAPRRRDPVAPARAARDRHGRDARVVRTGSVRVIAEPVLVVLAAQSVVAALPLVRALGSRVSPG